MKKFEQVASIFLLVSFLTRIMNLPWSGVIFIFICLVQSTFYFLFSIALFSEWRFKEFFLIGNYKKMRGLRIIGLISLGSGLSLTIIGILFYIQNWFGAESKLFCGILILFIVGILSFLKKMGANSDSKFYNNIILRVVIYVLSGMITFILF